MDNNYDSIDEALNIESDIVETEVSDVPSCIWIYQKDANTLQNFDTDSYLCQQQNELQLR